MKLYSSKQLLITALVTFCVSISIMLVGLNFVDFKKRSTSNTLGVNSQLLLNDQSDDSIKRVENGVNVSQSHFIETTDEKNNIDIYTQLNSAVVNITTEVLTYNWFLEAVPKEGGSGSGSIIDASGIILTNTHVVENAFKVFVNLSDGSQYEGKVIGKDPENDLAVVKINPKGKVLNTIELGSSRGLRIGQKVLAIGNPFGYDRTLTTGIVSGLARPVRSKNNLVIQNMIQTDASINPGNSGGPLINSSGEMIGINTMIYSPSGGSVGIGFSVPVDTAKRVIPDLIKFGSVKRGWIDITPVQLNSRIAEYAKLPVNKGILVSKLVTGGVAQKAGLRGGTQAVRYGNSVIYLGGDIIIEIDKQEVHSFTDLFSALEDNKPGDQVELVIIRNKKKLKLSMKLGERPANLLQDR